LIDRVLSWFWERVANSARVPRESLSAFRWIIGLYVLIFDAPDTAWIGRAPRAFFNPPTFSLSYLVGRFPPEGFFLLLDVAGILALVAMTIGWKTRWSTAVLLITRVIGLNFGYSFGKIDHTEILLSVLLLCMVMCDWGDADQPRISAAPTETSRSSIWTDRALALIAVALAFGFLTAGLAKAHAWLTTGVGSSGVLSWYYPNLFELGRSHLLAGAVPHIPLALLKVGDWAAVVLELSGFLFLLRGRVTWRVYLLLVSLLHLTNILLLNISFSTQAITYLIFVDLTFLQARISRIRPALVALAAGVAVVQIGVRVGGTGSPIAFVVNRTSAGVLILYVGLVIGLCVVGALVREIAIERRRDGVPVAAGASL
jgi:hypothetical protein